MGIRRFTGALAMVGIVLCCTSFALADGGSDSQGPTIDSKGGKKGVPEISMMGALPAAALLAVATALLTTRRKPTHKV